MIEHFPPSCVHGIYLEDWCEVCQVKQLHDVKSGIMPPLDAPYFCVHKININKACEACDRDDSLQVEVQEVGRCSRNLFLAICHQLKIDVLVHWLSRKLNA